MKTNEQNLDLSPLSDENPKAGGTPNEDSPVLATDESTAWIVPSGCRKEVVEANMKRTTRDLEDCTNSLAIGGYARKHASKGCVDIDVPGLSSAFSSFNFNTDLLTPKAAFIVSSPSAQGGESFGYRMGHNYESESAFGSTMIDLKKIIDSEPKEV